MNVMQLISSRLGFYGAERVVLALSTALDEMGVNTTVAAFQNTIGPSHLELLDKASLRGLKTERIVCNGRLDRGASHTIHDIVERHNIDVIHCHGIKAVLYALLAARHGVALVATCHLWTFDSAEEWGISALERCMLHAIDHVVVVSDQILPQLRRFGVEADVIYNGIDIEPIRSSNSDFRQKMNWCDRPVIGTVARLAKQKGIQYLLRAIPTVLRDYPNALFVLVGDGPERQSLETEAKGLGVEDAVSFLGVRTDIAELLSAMDIVAMPSLSEGLPMALLEAMASAKAVVATPVGAVRHMIQDRVNGILRSPGDVGGLATALKDLLKSRELRMTLGQNARETVESRFSAASMAGQYIEVYREAAFSKRHAVPVL